MTRSTSHPSLDQWVAWVRSDAPDRELEDHYSHCGGCRSLVETLRLTRSRERRVLWRDPPRQAVDAVLRAPHEPRLRPRRHSRSFPWSAADVRGDGAGAVLEDARIVAGSCQAGEVSVLVRPPMEQPDWNFEVRIWLHENPQGRAEIGLVHDDHVLVRHEVADGQTLHFADVVGEGWELEIHMSDDETIVLRDPYAEENTTDSSG